MRIFRTKVELLAILVQVLGFCIYAAAWKIPGYDEYRRYTKYKTKNSRGSGTSVIPFGYVVVVLAAFGLFAVLLGMVLFYKRDRGTRNKEKTLYLASF